MGVRQRKKSEDGWMPGEGEGKWGGEEEEGRERKPEGEWKG